jgi:hypothetical protein
MDSNRKSYAIVKTFKKNDKIETILLVDTHSEIWEFDNFDEAQLLADILTKNSDSGWVYFVRSINEK